MQRSLFIAALGQFGAHCPGCRYPLLRPGRDTCRWLLVGSKFFRSQHRSHHDLKSMSSMSHRVHPSLLVMAVLEGDDTPIPSSVSCSDATAMAAVKRVITDGAPADSELESSEENLPVPLTPFSSEYSKTVELERAMVAEAAMNSRAAVTKEDVIFEDEWLLVLNKPSGVYSEHVLATVKIMLRGNQNNDCAGTSAEEASEPFAHLANRLDRDTSGILVLTKSKEACGKLTNAFTERQVDKTYIARCAGQTPTWREVRIESGHGRSRYGAWRVYSVHDIGRKLPGRGCSTVKEMKTRLLIPGGSEEEALDVVVSTAMPTNRVGDDGLSEVILRAFPLTGRTHQVRLHCCYLGLPLIGDVKYGGPHEWNGVRYDGHCLHAESILFQHPVTHQALHLFAPMPNWATGSGFVSSSQLPETV